MGINGQWAMGIVGSLQDSIRFEEITRLAARLAKQIIFLAYFGESACARWLGHHAG
jgi:hypothetical protein